jgi:hypothetical protein
MAQLLERFEMLADRIQAAFIISHHFSKGSQTEKESIDRSSGAGVFGRDPDTIISITPHKEADAYIVAIDANDYPPMETFSIRFDYPRFMLAPELDPTEFKQPKNRAKAHTEYDANYVLAPLIAADQEGGLTYTEHFHELQQVRLPDKEKPISSATFKRRLGDLRDNKSIYLGQNGKYQLTPQYRKKLDTNGEEQDNEQLLIDYIKEHNGEFTNEELQKKALSIGIAKASYYRYIQSLQSRRIVDIALPFRLVSLTQQHSSNDVRNHTAA